MFSSTNDHLRIRLHQFEVRDAWIVTALRALRRVGEGLPRRYLLHALVLGVALASAAAAVAMGG